MPRNLKYLLPLLLGNAFIAFPKAHAASVGGSPSRLRTSVDSFVKTESSIAFQQMLCNIGADGCHTQGIDAGIVIASPSTEDPDYFYTWTRDSALVFKYVVERFVDHYDADLQHRIEDYITSQAILQGNVNLLGSLVDGKGLGEPKFETDLKSFKGEWGRPQRDGPALRAITLTTYANWLIENGYASTALDLVWPVVQNDLNYVAQYWNATGFDVWEEVNGSSFFSTASQYRALVYGGNLAAALNVSNRPFSVVASHILCFLQSFWMPSGKFIAGNINANTGRSGKDASSILGVIHNFDAKLGCDSATFQPCSDHALSNLKTTLDTFRSYEINLEKGDKAAIAVGRYIEDVYYGGNPWYLTTLAVAEQLYDAIYVWQRSDSINVTASSLSFFESLMPGIEKGTYPTGSNYNKKIMKAVATYADGFVEIVSRYAARNGSLSEQFSKTDGRPISARDLSWSYAAFLSAVARRAGIIPPSWSNEKATEIPTKCLATTITGSYSSATVTAFPPSQTPQTRPPHSSTSTSQISSSITTSSKVPCVTPTAVTVTFQIAAKTIPGQTIRLAGSTDSLGKWDISKSVPLDASEYKPDNPLWKTTVKLAMSRSEMVEFKYIKQNSDGTVVWERDPNRLFWISEPCVDSYSRRDEWRS